MHGTRETKNNNYSCNITYLLLYEPPISKIFPFEKRGKSARAVPVCGSSNFLTRKSLFI